MSQRFVTHVVSPGELGGYLNGSPCTRPVIHYWREEYGEERYGMRPFLPHWDQVGKRVFVRPAGGRLVLCEREDVGNGCIVAGIPQKVGDQYRVVWELAS